MPSAPIYITLIQTDIVWEDKQVNLDHYQNLIAGISTVRHIVVLPEMFSTGFTMSPSLLAESVDGPTSQWMKNIARKYRCILTGSIIIEEEGKYYNRLLWVQPDGNVAYYDKRHLFGFAGEDKHYAAGSSRVITQVNGWKCNLMVCYDLRFPVWSRNQGEEYDILIYVANWPEQRSLAWKTLLQARAIENQCYVVGVNRVGKDPKGNVYSGDSSVFGPLGETLWQHSHSQAVHTIALDADALNTARQYLPFLKDADKFLLL